MLKHMPLAGPLLVLQIMQLRLPLTTWWTRLTTLTTRLAVWGLHAGGSMLSALHVRANLCLQKHVCVYYRRFVVVVPLRTPLLTLAMPCMNAIRHFSCSTYCCIILNVMVVWTRLTRGESRMAVLYMQTFIRLGPTGAKCEIAREVALHSPRLVVVCVMLVPLEAPEPRGLEVRATTLSAPVPHDKLLDKLFGKRDRVVVWVWSET